MLFMITLLLQARQTERQTDRKTDRDRDTAERETETETDRDTETETDRDTEREGERACSSLEQIGVECDQCMLHCVAGLLIFWPGTK